MENQVKSSLVTKFANLGSKGDIHKVMFFCNNAGGGVGARSPLQPASCLEAIAV